MVVCKFYLEGRCKYGDNCRYEHIDAPVGGNNPDPFASANRPQGIAQRLGSNSAQQKVDDHPAWPFSAIALRNTAQGNLFEGDTSQEELRVSAYKMAPRGISQEVIQNERQVLERHNARRNSASGASGASMRPDQRMNKEKSKATPKDPFASAATPTQPMQPFQSMQPQPSFQQQHNPQQQQHPGAQNSLFGAPSQPAAQFSQTPSFGNSTAHNGSALNHGSQQTQANAPQQPPQPLSSEAEKQFSAAQFGFGNVPETAPPPQFY